jgi:hypothetical protein
MEGRERRGESINRLGIIPVYNQFLMQTDFDICSYSQMQAEEEISFFREEDCLAGQQTETAGWGWKTLN